MNVESRMDEFEKVSHKATNQDVEGRMDEFKTADKTQKHLIKEKSSSTLPYGLKRYKTCPNCGEFMEIDELKETEAIYSCKSCKQKMNIKIK